MMTQATLVSRSASADFHPSTRKQRSMGGKYARVLDGLPRYAGEEPSAQEQITAIKNAIVSEPGFQQHASTLAELYIRTRRGNPDARELSQEERDDLIDRLGKEGIAELLSECQKRMSAVEQLLVDQYQNEGTSSLTLDSGHKVAVQLEPYAQVQDREKFREWCVQEGLENLMVLPWATTNSLTKDRLVNGLSEPPGVTVYAKSKIVLRNS